MKLHELLNSITVIQVAGNVRDDEVISIEYDSRQVKKDSLFVAIKGFKVDGHKFIPDALNNGAIGIVLENDEAVPEQLFTHSDAAKILVKDSRAALAQLSHAFYGTPSDKINLIGITGTNGKTTTTYFIKNIFERAGRKTGLIGTIANYIGDKKIETKLTTPESSDLSKLLKEMYDEGCSDVVMEVSSHSLALKRVYALKYNYALFTNLTAEHLDFHHDFESYLKAKKILFDSLSTESVAIINADDRYSERMISDSNAKIYKYGTSPDADFKILDVRYDLNGTSFTINYNENIYPVETTLVGGFNAYNACAAFAVSILNGLPGEKIIEGIKTTPQVPGRFEVISGGAKKIIVDYAHTPDSLMQALKAIRDLNKSNAKVITVFGCGGNRDKLKRPEMGRIASELSDEVIITSDNPRDEDPFAIIDEIKRGVSHGNYKVIENREEAIKTSIDESDDNAIILIAGKGHEDYQEVKGVRTHFSDREVAEKYLRI